MGQRKYKNLVEAVLNGEINKEIPLPVLSYHEKDQQLKINILTPNDITLLFGATSSGKSKVGAYLIRQLLLKIADKNFLRFENKKKYRVVVIETEMAEENVKKYFMDDNFYEYKSMDKAGEDLSFRDCYEIYPINSSSMDECNEALRLFAKEQEKFLPDYNIIFFIDNLGSFVPDLNSSSNNGWMKEFKSTFSPFTVLCVMHANFKESSNNKSSATGSLGSAAQKIAANVFQVDKMDEGATLTLYKSKTQNDRSKPKLPLLITEKENALIVSVSKVPLTFRQNEDKSKAINIILSNRILNRLNGKPVESDERLKKNLVNAFPDLYKEKMMYQKIKEFEKDKILFQRNDFLFHKDESNK